MATCFDKKEVFEAECKPLLTQLANLCSVHKIPFFWTACVKNDDEKSEYVRDWCEPCSHNLTLKDDMIRKMYLIAASDYDIVPRQTSDEIEMLLADMDDV